MAATTAGGLKAMLETKGLGVPVFRAPAPGGQTGAFITISEGLSITPDGGGDLGDPAAVVSVAELAQVDVWQPLKDVATDTANPAIVESYTLVPAVLRALHGASVTAAPTHVYGCTVDSSVRLLEPDTNTVHTAITVRLRRNL